MLRLVVMLLCVTVAPAIADPIVLRDMGSFHIGGRVVEISGRPVQQIVRVPGGPPSRLDPNGRYQVEQMYVQFFLPRDRKGKYPLLLWHGGGLTGASFETTPDGREGFVNMFIRKGWGGTSMSQMRSSAAAPALPAPIFGSAIQFFSPPRIRSNDSASVLDKARSIRTPSGAK